MKAFTAYEFGSRSVNGGGPALLGEGALLGVEQGVDLLCARLLGE
jgi:hypothetical protein